MLVMILDWDGVRYDDCLAKTLVQCNDNIMSVPGLEMRVSLTIRIKIANKTHFTNEL